jgi:hypothetical protein
MELPKFLLADNTDFPDDLYVIHMEFPRFIINTNDESVELLDDIEEEEQSELAAELENLIVEAMEFFDREMDRYDEE